MSKFLQLEHVPKIRPKVYKYVREVPKTLVKADENSLPVAAVSNSQVNTQYTEHIGYWKKSSELSTPWISPTETKLTIGTSEIETKDLLQFNIDDKELDTCTIGSITYAPKLGAQPVAYHGWQAKWNSTEVYPKTALFSPSDCFALGDKKKRATVTVSSDELHKTTYLNDKRFELVEASSYQSEFCVVGKLSNEEWIEFERVPLPKVITPCGYDETIHISDSYGCEIPETLYGIVTPEWSNDGKYYVDAETAIKINKKKPNTMPTPANSAQKLTVSSWYGFRHKAGKINVEVTNLINCSLLVKEAEWAESKLSFNIEDILTWPTQPLKCEIFGEFGFISAHEYDPAQWERVSQSSGKGIPYVFQESNKKGYKKVHVINKLQKQAEQSIYNNVQQELGPDFETKYSKHLGTFNPEESDTYVKLAKFIDKNEICPLPSFIYDSPKSERQKKGIYTKAEVKAKLKDLNPDYHEEILVSLLLHPDFDNNAKKVLADILHKINPDIAELMHP